MQAIESDQAEFVDRIGMFFETVGGPRTMGRIYGWLMICDPPEQSLTELAGALAVSKASISTAVRPLLEGDLVERIPAADRQHRYRLMPGGFTQVLRVQLARMQAGVDAAEYGLSVIGDERTQQREHLKDFRDFCAFTAGEVQRDFMARWEQYRTRERSERDER